MLNTAGIARPDITVRLLHERVTFPPGSLGYAQVVVTMGEDASPVPYFVCVDADFEYEYDDEDAADDAPPPAHVAAHEGIPALPAGSFAAAPPPPVTVPTPVPPQAAASTVPAHAADAAVHTAPDGAVEMVDASSEEIGTPAIGSALSDAGKWAEPEPGPLESKVAATSPMPSDMAKATPQAPGPAPQKAAPLPSGEPLPKKPAVKAQAAATSAPTKEPATATAPMQEKDERGVRIGEFEFTDDVVKSGLAVGAAAIGSAATGGIWDGGNARSDPSFKTSKALADVGVAAGEAAIPVGSLSAGARSVFYSGGKEALEAANAGKGAGKILAETFGGKLLNKLQDFAQERFGRSLPLPVWKAASGIFALNAKGSATVFLRNPGIESVWNTVEQPILKALGRTIIAK